jgi:peptidyl-prolyl cis-trans isomerase C
MNATRILVAIGLVLALAACKKDAASPDAGAPAAAAGQATAPANAEARMTGPVVKVNGQAIDAKEFYGELDKITQGGARTIPEDRLKKIRENILNRLVEESLIQQEIQKQGVTVSDEELTAEFERYKARFKGEEQFQNYLTHGRTTVEEVKERLKSGFALTKLLTKLGKLDVSEDEVKHAYETGIKMYTEPEQVRAQHVLIKVAETAPADQADAAKKKALEVLAKAKKGDDFAALAKQYSDDTMSKEKGGELGFFRKGVMVPKFEEAAFALKPGELVKEPVRTPFGFHVIKTLEKKEERVKPFDEVKAQIQESLKNRNTFKARRELVEKLKAEAKIEKLIND